MNLGSAIKAIRKKLSVSQLQLAGSCGLSQTSLSHIENGIKHPSPKTIKKICSVLEIPEFVVYVIAMNYETIPESRKEAFRLLYPTIMKLALQLLDPEHLSLIDDKEKT